MASGDTKTAQLLDALENGGDISSIAGCCNTNLQNYLIDSIGSVNDAKDAIVEKGGTVGENTGLAGLASEIATIPSGSAPLTEYATLKYLDSSQQEHTLSVSKDEFDLLCLATTSWDDVTIDNTTIQYRQITEVTVNDGVAAIPNFFLVWCTGLTKVNLPDSIVSIGNSFCSMSPALSSPVNLTNVLDIGNNFFGSSSYNQPINLPNVEIIGDYFLQKSGFFNQPVTFGNKLLQIGSSFMLQCTAFNSAITLGNSLRHIGASFLSGCTAFAQSITLPSSIVSTTALLGIQGGFLYNAKNFTGPLVCNASASMASTASTILGTNDNTAPIYTTGVTLTGTHAQDWKDRYANSDVNPYRKLIVGS